MNMKCTRLDANIFSKLLVCLLCFSGISFVKAQDAVNETTDSLASKTSQTEYIPDVSDELIADRLGCLENEVKLTFNKTIRGFIDYFTIRNRKYPLVMERRKNLYFPIFEEYLKKHNMPEELKYLSIVESGLNPRAMSRVGAAGLWQFMPSTGKMFKLYQDEYIDERLDPYKSTEAACKYLKELYNIFDDWQLALASYNCGPGNVRRAIRKSGYKDSFWEVYNFLPKETRAYVPQFVALTYVMNHLEDHNIIADSLEYPMNFDTVIVTQYMDLDVFCDKLNICSEDFMKLNPGIKKNILPNHEGRILRIPSDKAPLWAANRGIILDSCSRKFNFLPGNENTGSLNIALEDNKVKTPEPRQEKRKSTYIVKRGENLGRIADKYNVSITDLKKWNGLKGGSIRIGQKLVVYQNGPSKSTANTNVSTAVARTNQSSAAAASKAKKAIIHYVQPGDTLWTISRKYDGITIEKIKKLNKLKGNDIKIGQKLILG